MSVDRSAMPTIALVLAAVVVVFGVLLWSSPWKSDQQTADKAAAGGTAAVKYDHALADKGKSIAGSNGCTSCHTTDGSSGAGPTWAGLWGSKGVVTGKPVDTAYVEEILTNPPPVMSNFKGKFSDAEEDSIAEYIKSLQ